MAFDMSGFPSPSLDATGGALASHGGPSALSEANDARDVRGRLTRLTARARQFVLDDTDTRVVRNGLSVYETSRRTAADTGSRARPVGRGAHPPIGPSQASAELFMTTLGFNLPEQQRLLQQLQAAAAPERAAAPSAVSFAGEAAGDELDVWVAARRHAFLRHRVEAVHRRVAAVANGRADAVLRAGWQKHVMEASDAFASLALRADASPPAPPSAARAWDAGAVVDAAGGEGNAGLLQSRAGVAALLGGRGEASARMRQRVGALARMVQSQPSAQWPAQCAAGAGEDAAAADLARLWADVEEMLTAVAQHGAGATPMALVAASRQVMERRALMGVLARTLRVDPARMHEMAQTHPSRLVDIIEKYTGVSNPWVHMYTAMRCGRYDAAALLAGNMGQRLVAAQLRTCADTAPSQRHAIPPAHDLRALYKEDATRTDPHRHMVLLLLLGGTGEGDEAELATVTQLLARVARSLEETLWVRLVLLREAEATEDGTAGSGGRIRLLAEMQRLLLDDMTELVTCVRGDAVRLASLLIHALLPSSGIRLLIEGDATYVDGVHMAMCFHNCHILTCTSMEAAIDMCRHVPQYCSLVLLDPTHRDTLAGAVFDYFHKTDLTSTFVEYACQEVVCARLFGPRAPLPGGAAPALLHAMERIADAAAARGQTALAVHVLCALESAAALAQDAPRAGRALCRALHVLCPALAHSLHAPPSAAWLHPAARLRRRLASATHAVPPALAEAFALLAAMADVASAAARGEWAVALRAFAALPFAPSRAEEAAAAAARLEACAEGVAAAAAPVARWAARAMGRLAETHRAAGEEREAAAMRRRLQALAAWVRRWRRQQGRGLVEEITSLEQTLAR